MLNFNSDVTQISEEGAFAVSDRAAQLSAQGKDVINLGIGQPDFLPPEHVLTAAEKAARDGPHGYTSPVGILSLREAVAADISARYSCDINPDQVVIVPGGKVTIFFAAMLFGGKGREILFPDPGFPPYREAIISAGAWPVSYKLDEAADFSFSADDILEKINPQTSLIIINSPGNPTGSIVSIQEMEKLASGLADFPHVAILSDEIYNRLVFEPSEFVSFLAFPELRDRVIYLDGWSKTFAMTGWRLGFGIWPSAMIEHVRKLITVDHSCVNGVAQMAALAATTGPQDIVEERLAAFRQRRKIVFDGLNALPGMTCRLPGGAFYAFPNISAISRDGEKLASDLLEKAHIATIAGDSFGANGRGYLRISYAAKEEELNSALARMTDFFAEYG